MPKRGSMMITFQPPQGSSLRQDLFYRSHAVLLNPRHASRYISAVTAPYLQFMEDGRRQTTSSSIFRSNSMLRLARPLSRTRAYYIPGFLELAPDDEQITRLSQMAEYGAAILTQSPDASYINYPGNITFIGGPSGYYSDDWRTEVASLVQRLYVDLKEQEAKNCLPEHLIFVGHSKGGLLLDSLAALFKAKESGQLKNILATFPGLDQVDDGVLDFVACHLKGAFYFVVGNNMDGYDHNNPAIKIVTSLMHLSDPSVPSLPFQSDFLNQHYRASRLVPEDPEHGLDGVITTRYASGLLTGLAKAWHRVFTNMFNPAYRWSMWSLDLSAAFTDSDGMVPRATRAFVYKDHISGFNHAEQLGAMFAGELENALIKAIRHSKKQRLQGLRDKITL